MRRSINAVERGTWLALLLSSGHRVEGKLANVDDDGFGWYVHLVLPYDKMHKHLGNEHQWQIAGNSIVAVDFGPTKR